MIHEHPLNIPRVRLYQHIKKISRFLTSLLVMLVLFPTTSAAVDSDADGHDDAVDNCIEIANSDQRDSNGDGFGNVCDADLDNNGMVSFGDLSLFRAAFDTNDADADLDGSGLVSFGDLTMFRALFDRPPGPAGDGGGGGGDLTEASAARFLTQATFGPTAEGIDQLISQGSYEGWIDDQIASAPTLLTPGTQAIFQAQYDECIAQSSGSCVSLEEVTTAGADNIFDTESIQHHFVWWDNAIDADDQLRQRVAFALSQIMVVSNRPTDLHRSQFALADYYDTLTENAFGNFRDLLEDVSLHAVMGMYLGHVKNERADPDRNIRPDENYAREVLQLFSIGLHRLNLDGTPILGTDGRPEPTYGQFEVQEFARVFTGWNFAGVSWTRGHGGADNTLPMEAHEEYHDTDAKVLLDGEPIPAGQTAQQDLDAALDNIFNHPNVGPFIGKLLIQRLVTSNPTPEYVSRVASRFNDNGQGLRGDMGAVVKEILLDPEARNGHENINGFGKLREPLLRITHLLRTFDASQTEDAYWDWIIPEGTSVYAIGFSQTSLDNRVGQRIMRSPSVFNFYQPNYSPPGVVREGGLVAPEFQIVTENSNMAMTNILNTIIFRDPDPRWSILDLDNETSLATDPDALLEHLNLMLMSGDMSNELRTIIRTHLDDPGFDVDRFSEEEELRTMVRSAIALIVNSPEYLIQK